MQILTVLYLAVKSLRAIEVKSAVVEEKGFMGDRVFMLVTPLPLPVWGSFGPKDATHRFFTQRQCPSLATVVATIKDGTMTLSSYKLNGKKVSFSITPKADAAKYRSTLWDSIVKVQDLGDVAAKFLQEIVDQDDTIPEELKSAKVRLVVQAPEDVTRADANFVPPGARNWLGQSPKVPLNDGFPILIANERSVEEVNRRLKEKGKDPLVMSNFRPNIVVSGKEAFEEDRWKVIRIGKAIFHIVKGCPRCKESCTNQTNGEVRDEPLKVMSEFRAFSRNPEDIFFAQNMVVSPMSVGETISVGDKLEILEWGEPVWE